MPIEAAPGAAPIALRSGDDDALARIAFGGTS